MPKKGNVIIDEKRCKGCDICIKFCPKDVLAMGDDSKAKVQNAEQCIACQLCALRCPDLAIVVEEVENEESKVAPGE